MARERAATLRNGVPHEVPMGPSYVSRMRALGICAKGTAIDVVTGEKVPRFLGACGNLLFRIPETKSAVRVDVMVATLYGLAGFGPEVVVNHIDGDRTNCRLENLRYMTPAQDLAATNRRRVMVTPQSLTYAVVL